MYIQEQNIPIDIQTSKLVDWLISRRHCTKTWTQQITTIREKINSAIQDMPEHKGIVKLLTGTCNYLCYSLQTAIYVHFRMFCCRYRHKLFPLPSDSGNLKGN